MIKLTVNWLIIWVLLQITLKGDHFHQTKQEILEELAEKIIYYGSTVRMKHVETRYHLHSHDISYGSGSRQQSVTAVSWDNDYNSLWTIKDSTVDKYPKTYQDIVKCGDNIRLEHMMTKKNLHSHNERSPVSNEQEISAFGQDGDGDTGDDFVLVCQNYEAGTSLNGDFRFHIMHRETQRYVKTRKDMDYNARNCGRQCPIEGQLEVAAVRTKGYDTEWEITGGLFYEPPVYEYEWEAQLDDDQDYDENKVDDEGYQEIIYKKSDL